jgi:hypothetical protein
MNQAGPCYYFAYNTACAYSRLEKGKEAIQWLTIAFRMNGTLAKLVPGDKDRAYVREKNKTELDELLKKYGKANK